MWKRKLNQLFKNPDHDFSITPCNFYDPKQGCTRYRGGQREGRLQHKGESNSTRITSEHKFARLHIIDKIKNKFTSGGLAYKLSSSYKRIQSLTQWWLLVRYDSEVLIHYGRVFLRLLSGNWIAKQSGHILETSFSAATLESIFSRCSKTFCFGRWFK